MKRKVTKMIKMRAVLIFLTIATLAVIGLSPFRIFAEEPPGCQTSGSFVTITVLPVQPAYAVGQEIRYVVTLENPTFNGAGLANCNISNIWMILAKPDGSIIPILTNQNLVGGGNAIVCPGDPACLSPSNSFNYTIRQEDLTNINVTVCPPSPGSTRAFTATVHREGTVALGAFGAGVNDNKCANAPVVTPCLTCVKRCVDAMGPDGLITFTGEVVNCETNTGVLGRLSNVQIYDVVNGVTNIIASGATLTNGQVFPFSGSYLNPNPCVPISDTVFASGVTAAGTEAKTSCSATCSNILLPAIFVTKLCPPNPVEPGTPLVFSGIVSNSGNVTLTNVLVVNDRPVANTPVFGPITLGPGQSTNFTGSYTVPADSCGPYTDTLTALGTSICGVNVTNMASATCPGTNSPAIFVSKSCPQQPIEPGQILTITGTVTNIGNITLTNVTVTNTIAALGGISRQILGPLTLAPGAGNSFTDSYTVPLNSCGPYRDTVLASGTEKCFGRIVTASDFKDCPGTNSPLLAVTKDCPPGLIQPGQLLTIFGTITNKGNITLTNVTVTNIIAALGNTNRQVFGPVDLAPGAGATFTDSYIIPLDSCGPYRDTLIAMGADKCFGRIVTSTDFKDCFGTNSPSIVVTKSCPPGLLQPGETLNITGTVTNTGNITLTNVTVTNTIAAIGATRRVLGPITLAPGAGTTFNDSYVVPLDSCGPYRDTVLASGADKCFGREVTSTDIKDCPSTNSPAIVVNKSCPPNPVPPGGVMVISGVVSNAGNITLTNVTVTNVITGIGTHSILGPINLAPGTSLPFTDTYMIPTNSCGPFPDTITAQGNDKCFGRLVTASDTKNCPIITTPKITVVKRCPANPVVPGGIAIFSGTVSNAGNIALTNVTVVNNRPTNNTPVLGPVTLLPGQAINFTGSEAVPPNCCEYFDTLMAVGASICTGSNVMASASAACPTLVLPKITVTKSCPPAPVPLGQPLVFTGTVSNSGNIALINVTVVDNQPSNNTPVFGPLTLAPGEAANFSGSFPVPINTCDTNISDIVTARGTDVCLGSNVTATAGSLCPILPTPRLTVTKQCPPNPVAPGQLLVFTGTVSNSGTITITNITVVNDRPSPNTVVLGQPITLAPGQVTNFSGSYIAPYDCCGPCVDTLTARGNEVCAGSNVVGTASAACPRSTSPAIIVTRDCPPAPVMQGDLVFVTGIVSNSGNATLGNVTITDDQAGDVLDNLVLAPGESVPYFGMYITTDCGHSLPAVVTAIGNDICTGVAVTNRVVASCEVLCPGGEPLVLFNEKVEGGKFVFSFITDLNHSYLVEYTDTLNPVNWLPLGSPISGTGGGITVNDTLTAQRLYRVKLQ